MQKLQTEGVASGPLWQSLLGAASVAKLGKLSSLGLRLPDSHRSLPSASSRW